MYCSLVRSSRAQLFSHAGIRVNEPMGCNNLFSPRIFKRKTPGKVYVDGHGKAPQYIDMLPRILKISLFCIFYSVCFFHCILHFIIAENGATEK